MSLSAWKLAADGKSISRVLHFKGFNSAWAFCTQVAMQAHLKNHHPKIVNEFKRVELTLTTHDQDKLTDKDYEMAKAFDRMATKYLE